MEPTLIVSQLLHDQNYCLPEIYNEYLNYYLKVRQVHINYVKKIRRVLMAFHNYLEKLEIKLPNVKIEQIDSFWSEFNSGFTPKTFKIYRSYLRGFLKYLYYECKILKKDIAPLIDDPPILSNNKPSKFLRTHEIQKLFDSLDISTTVGLRTNAMLYLAYAHGLLARDICLITLDDISFTNKELRLKAQNHIKHQLSDNAIKAIAAYIIGARAESEYRTLFLTLTRPYKPITPTVINYHFKVCLRKNELILSAYSLRHTYAQNLFEAGFSLYEIKEMMGHKSIKTTEKYICINIKLIRRILFNEEI